MKGLLLLSGGIDSPVAGHLMIERGVQVDMIHFDNSDTKKAKLLAKAISKKAKLYIIKHRRIISEITNCDRRMTCVLCKRLMYSIGEKVAKRDGHDIIITGDNLGQVASQTLDNMAAITSGIKIPIIRPLLCMDKVETVVLAKRIGTYGISIEKSPACTAVPKHPVTKTSAEKIEEELKKIDEKRIINEAIESMAVEEIS